MSSIKAFLEFLNKRKNDRGLMADLRHGFSKGTEYRAWPHIAKWGCDLENEKARLIWLTVAAGFATHEQTAACENMGFSLRRLALEGQGDSVEKALKTFDARFRRLLTCSTAKEVCDRLIGVIKAAERKNVPVNYEKLFWDLMCWENPEKEIKIKWAAQYWGAAEKPEQEGENNVSDTDTD